MTYGYKCSFDEKNRSMTLKLLWKLMNSSPEDPAAPLRILAKEWKAQKERVSNAVPGFEKWQGEFAQLEARVDVDEFDALAQCMQFAISFNEMQTSKTAEEMEKIYRKHPQCQDQAKVGKKIMEMNYSITSNSLFGLVVLHVMGLTVDKIASMDETHRIVFMMIMTPTAGEGCVNRFVPEYHARIVDVYVEGFLPMLE